jgi:glutamine synthetase
MHVGGDGQLRVLDFAPSSNKHLKDVLLHGERADGSSIFNGLGIDTRKSDIVLHPRIETAFIEPFSEIPAMAVLCDHYDRDGRLLSVSPSTIVRRAAERFKEASNGAELWSLGEVEYFVGSDVSKTFQKHELRCHDWAEEGGYHAVSPTALFLELRRKAICTLADIGVPVKYAHGEVGLISPSDATKGMTWEQHEIELALAPLVQAADGLVLTEWVLSSLAKEMHLAISFRPMLLQGHAGSGLHQHMSVVCNGVHLPHVNRDDGMMSDSTSWLVSGLLELGGALMCVGNRTEDSFLRLTQGSEAPKGVFWGYFNRGSMIRLPVQVVSRRESENDDEIVTVVTPATVEYRLGDGSAFPHLLLAGIAQAATLGASMPREMRMRRIAAGAASESDARAVSHDHDLTSDGSSFEPAPVPLSMPEVARELEHCQAQLCAGGVFPKETMQAIRATLLKT